MKSYKKPLLVIVGLTILALASYFTYKTFFTSFDNYAKDAAKPLEKSLIAHGAIKKCEKGDSGLGPDNREPWYTVYFGTSKNRLQTEVVMLKIAKELGFDDIKEMPKDTKGYLGDKVYTATSTTNKYPNLSSSSVSLAIALTNKSIHPCTKTDLYADDSHTAISLELSLASFK